MPKYVVSSSHAVDLASGRVVGDGESVTLSDSDAGEDHNVALIDSGVLVETSTDRKRGNKEAK